MSIGHPSVFLSLIMEGDNELQSVSAPQASTPLIHLSWNSPTASAEENFIDDGALREGVDVSFVDIFSLLFTTLIPLYPVRGGCSS